MAVDYIHPSLKEDLKVYQFINDLLDGYDGIVNKKETYLPKTYSESLQSSSKVYDARQQLACYLDSFNPIIDGLNGLIFQNPITYDTTDEDILTFLDEATQDKKDFNFFIKKFFKSALAKGRSYAYVDIPQGNENLTTNQQRLQAGIKPFVVFIRPDDIINYRTAIVNGKTQITMIVIRETIEVEKDDFEIEFEKQYRVLKIGSVEIYDNDYKLISTSTTGLDYIPIVELNLDEDGTLFNARPPFLNVGRLGIDVYSRMSDSMWASHHASIPVLKLLGFSKEDAEKFVISVNSAILSENENAKADYLDYDGKGVEVNLKLIEKLEQRIAEIGMSVLSSNKQQVTATEKTLDTIQTQSKLSNWVDSLKDSLKLILNYVAMYYSKEYSDNIIISADILDNGLTAEEMAKYSEMVAKGQLSNITLWEIFKSKGRLPDDFDSDLESERIADENVMPNTSVSNNML